MTRLEERMARCLDMARTATTLREQDLYLMELAGLWGMPSTGIYSNQARHAYERGLSDRATLLKLGGIQNKETGGYW